MTPRLQIVNLKLLTTGWPTQWEGLTDDGEYVFVYFRHGALRISMATASIDAYPKWSCGPDIWVDEEVGTPTDRVLPDERDGIMSSQEMQRRTGEILDWHLCERSAIAFDREAKKRVLSRRLQTVLR